MARLELTSHQWMRNALEPHRSELPTMPRARMTGIGFDDLQLYSMPVAGDGPGHRTKFRDVLFASSSTASAKLMPQNISGSRGSGAKLMSQSMSSFFAPGAQPHGRQNAAAAAGPSADRSAVPRRFSGDAAPRWQPHVLEAGPHSQGLRSTAAKTAGLRGAAPMAQSTIALPSLPNSRGGNGSSSLRAADGFRNSHRPRRNKHGTGPGHDMRQEAAKLKHLALTPSDKRGKAQKALEGDRSFVQRALQQAAEPLDVSEARERRAEDRQWAIIFAPISRAREQLPGSMRQRPPPLVARTIRDLPEVPAEDDLPELFKDEEEEALHACRLFHSLVSLGRKAAEAVSQGRKADDESWGPVVLTRPSFCRLVCAMEGLSIAPGEQTFLRRAAGHFDRAARRIRVQGGIHGGHVLGVEITPGQDQQMVKLFAHLLHDMINDVRADEASKAQLLAVDKLKKAGRPTTPQAPGSKAPSKGRPSKGRPSSGSPRPPDADPRRDSSKGPSSRMGSKDLSAAAKAAFPGDEASPTRTKQARFSGDAGGSARRDSWDVRHEIDRARKRLFGELLPGAVQYAKDRSALARRRALTGWRADGKTAGAGPDGGLGPDAEDPVTAYESQACGRLGPVPETSPVMLSTPTDGSQAVPAEVGKRSSGEKATLADQGRRGSSGKLSEAIEALEEAVVPEEARGKRAPATPMAAAPAGRSPLEEPSPEAQAPGSSQLYGHTFAVLKGELLMSQMLEPEVMHFVSEFGDLFTTMFNAYCDTPVMGETTHMTLTGFLRFCNDFRLFPEQVDFQTILWLYETAEAREDRSPGDDEAAAPCASEPGTPLTPTQEVKGAERSGSNRSISRQSRTQSPGGGKSPPRQTSSRQSSVATGSRQGRRPVSPGRQPTPKTPTGSKTPTGRPSSVVSEGWGGREAPPSLQDASSAGPASRPMSGAAQPRLGSPARERRSTVRSPSASGSPRRQTGALLAASARNVTIPFSEICGQEDELVLCRGKWFNAHLAWLTKDFSVMSEPELASASLLWAINDWVEDRRLMLDSFLVFVDTDCNGCISESELQFAVKFMNFENPPSKEDVSALFALLQTPTLEGLHGEVPIQMLRMALIAVGIQTGERNQAANCFAKDFSKLSRAECNASIFLKGMWQAFHFFKKSPEEVFMEFAADRPLSPTGALSSADLSKQALHLLKMLPFPSPALSVENPLELLDPSGKGITCEQFCQYCHQVKQAAELRTIADKDKHPILLAQSTKPAVRDLSRIFGSRAFIECIVKMSLVKLTFHGTAMQAELTSLVKVTWVLLYLRWQFEAAKQRDMQLSFGKPNLDECMLPPRRGQGSRGGSRPGTRGSATGGDSRPGTRSRIAQQEREEGPGSKSVKCRYVAPLKWLLTYHPNMFLNAPAHQPPSGLQVVSSVEPCVACGHLPFQGWGFCGCSVCSSGDAALAAGLAHARAKGAPGAGLATLDRCLLLGAQGNGKGVLEEAGDKDPVL